MYAIRSYYGMNFYGNMPDSFNLVVNGNHPLVERIVKDKNEKLTDELKGVKSKIETLEKRRDELEKAKKDKKDEEIPSAEKEELTDVEHKLTELKDKKKAILGGFASDYNLVKQLIDLAVITSYSIHYTKLYDTIQNVK